MARDARILLRELTLDFRVRQEFWAEEARAFIFIEIIVKKSCDWKNERLPGV